MKIEIDAEVFAKKVASAARALPSKPILPWQGALRLTFKNNSLKIQGIDPDSMLIATEVGVDTDDSDSDNEFDCLVTGALLADLCKDLPKAKINLHVEENQIQLETKNGVYKLPVIAGEYPSLGEEVESYHYVNFESFANLVNNVSVAAARNDANFCNVQIEFNDKTVKLAATDRYRLGYGAIDLQEETENQTILVNAKLLDSGLKTVTKEENIKIGADGSFFYIKNSDTLVKVRLSGGAFPNFASLLEKKEVGELTVKSKLLQESLKRVAKFSANRVKLEISSEEISVQTPSEEIGSAREKIQANWSGSNLVLVVNPNYIIDALNSLNVETVTVKPTGTASMMKIVGNTDITHLVMPLRD
jgi:DNA polymerase-3 subunit beta